MPAISKPSYDATIRHQVFLERLKASLEKDIVPYLKRIDKKIRERLSGLELTTYQRVRLRKLLISIDKMIDGELTKYSKQLLLDLRELGVTESVFESRSLNNVIDSPDWE